MGQSLDLFLAGNDVAKLKPDPTIYLTAAERLGGGAASLGKGRPVAGAPAPQLVRGGVLRVEVSLPGGEGCVNAVDGRQKRDREMGASKRWGSRGAGNARGQRWLC